MKMSIDRYLAWSCRILITGLVLISNCSPDFCQINFKIDSLKHAITKVTNPEQQVNILIDLCSTYRLFNADSAIYYGRRAYTLANSTENKKGEILALGFLSQAFNSSGNFSASLEYGLKAINLSELYRLEKFSSPAFDGVGRVYLFLKDYDHAAYYFQKQLMVSQKYSNSIGIAYAYANVGKVYTDLGRLDTAKWYFEQSLNTFRLLNVFEPIIVQRAGDVEYKLGSISKAFDLYTTSLEYGYKNKELRVIPVTLMRLAMYYNDLGKVDSCRIYAQNSLEMAIQLKQKQNIIESAKLLAHLNEAKDPVQALNYYKLAWETSENLFGSANLQAVQTITDQELNRKKEIATANILFRNRLKQYILLTGLLILSVSILFLYRNIRIKQKINNQLAEQNVRIEQQKNQLTMAFADLKSTQNQLVQTAKMASLGELTAGIAHEIQNPLNFVNNFSEVNKELIEELKSEKLKTKSERNEQLEDELLSDIAQNLEKINLHGKRADGIVKSMLQHSRVSTGQMELTDLNGLCDEYLRLGYHGLRAKDSTFQANFQTEFDPALPKIKVVPQDIGRVILNLVNNAFYAVHEKAKQNNTGYEPMVEIRTKPIDGKVQITTKDNGTGIPEHIKEKIFQPFFTTKPTGQGTGLGLSLSYDIVKAHGGELKVATEEGEGSVFIIQLPVF